MTGERPDGTIALVADLHLAAGDHDPFTEDRHFAATVTDLAATAAGRPFRLVLLGDTFDFPAVVLPGRRATPATAPEEALLKLDRILAAHPVVLDALRAVVAAGHRLDLVAGNHDMEITLLPVEERLRQALGSGPGRLEVHPWMLVVPGVLYAEHGQQHHDVNRFPGLLTTSSGAGYRLPVPAGSYLDELTHLRQRRPGSSPLALAAEAAGMGAGLVRALARLGAEERRRGERERRLACAPPAGLPPETVLEIDRAAAASPGSVARRAAAMALGRARGSRRPTLPYMHAAAASVHRALAASGNEVPFHVFGHTHVQADVPLPGDGSGRYLNPGTWSSMTRRVPGGDRRCGVVVVESTGDTLTAAVRRST